MLVFLLSCGVAGGQTMARPGWAGSGMTVERWWTHAVICEVRPDGLGPVGEGSGFRLLAARIEDLQTLGVDAVLLRGVEVEALATGGDAVAVDSRFGTMEEFDGLVGEAVRHRIRVLVELRGGARGSSFTADARFWLNHGVTGLDLGSGDAAEVADAREVLRGYVGERVLIAGDGGREEPGRAGEPDLVRVSVPPVERGAGAMRAAIGRARTMDGKGSAVALLSGEDGGADAVGARVMAAALLGSGGAVLLRADDLDLAHAGDATQSSVFAWYRQWSGLHRGDRVLRSGEETLLDHDDAGALVWVRQSRGEQAPIVAICNVTDKPLRLSLVEDIQRLRLRGSFLRTLARSDGGMGAMPLRAIVLPAYGVYVGELSR